MKTSLKVLLKTRFALAVIALVAIGLFHAPIFSHAGNSPAAKHPAPQNPFTALEDAAKEKVAEDGLSTLLNNQLPLTLDAKNVYPTVDTLPGGPFDPTPLMLGPGDVDQPLPPGDYTVNTMAFCSEYSTHLPGAGVAYVLGPYEGKAAGAIGELIWRGTLQYGIAPQQLQTVSWAIQSGLTYTQMPQSYQAIIDQVIPDLKSEISGDFFASLENSYNASAKTLKLPPLDQMLAKMGKPGELALSAEKQRSILTQQNTSDQLKDQTLYQGQESGVYTPVKEESGPWTERVKGVAYMKLQIVGGNMNSNNVMQIRILPTPGAAAAFPKGPRARLASYRSPQVPDAAAVTTITALMKGSLGYSQGQGAQALGQVPVITRSGTITRFEGTVNVIHKGSTIPVPLKAGDPVYRSDQIQTGPMSRAEVVFVDNTVLTLGESTTFAVEDYAFDPAGQHHNKAHYGILEGAFQYVSGLLAKSKDHDVNIDTPYGCIGIRASRGFVIVPYGTEFVVNYDSASSKLEVDLIDGSITIGAGSIAVTQGGAPVPTYTAPVQITVNASGTKTAPITQAQYNTMLSQLGISP